MAKLPRDVSGGQLVARLRRLGYAVARQRGSHVRLKHADGQRITIPLHQQLKAGTLADIVGQLATQRGISVSRIREILFEK